MIFSCYSHHLLSILLLELDASLPRLQDEEHTGNSSPRVLWYGWQCQCDWCPRKVLVLLYSIIRAATTSNTVIDQKRQNH
jgi:hypothetical protein